MKKAIMKGKNVDEAKKAALAVLGGSEENAVVRVIKEGKAAMLGVLGGEDAEVEVILKGEVVDDARELLQEILDKMQFVAVVSSEKDETGRIQLVIKGEDMGRIIGKDGGTIGSFETLVRAMLGRLHADRILLSIDAGDYKKKRGEALERIAKDAADEVVETGKEKVLPPMNAADRRTIHMFLQDKPGVSTFSKGEGRDRRLVIIPKE